MKIKRAWLALLIFGFISSFVSFYVAVFLIKTAPVLASKRLLSDINIIYKNGNFLTWLIHVPIVFFCSYSKPGSKLLFLEIVAWVCYLPLLILSMSRDISLYSRLSVSGSLNLPWNLSACRFLLIESVISVLWGCAWLYCCIHLRRYNLKWRYELVIQNPNYKACLDGFGEMNDFESLTSFYFSSVNKYPQIEKFLTKAFKKQKEHLGASKQ